MGAKNAEQRRPGQAILVLVPFARSPVERSLLCATSGLNLEVERSTLNHIVPTQTISGLPANSPSDSGNEK